MVTYVKVSGATQATKDVNYADVFPLGRTRVSMDLYIYAYINLNGKPLCMVSFN